MVIYRGSIGNNVMKIVNMVKFLTTGLVAIIGISLASVAFSANSSVPAPKDFKLVHADGGQLRSAHVAVAARRGYPGVNPNVVKMASASNPNCFHARFVYKGVLKEITFNCSNGQRELTMLTR